VNILEKILAAKRREIDVRLAEQPLPALRAAAERRPAPPPFAAALRQAPLGLIAEVKHKSPSAGVIRCPFDPAGIAREYERAGAHAVSVLMDREFFGGGEEHFRAVRGAVRLPMLYKEFVVDPWQIWHARHLGASAVLLIGAALPPAALELLMAEAAAAGLEVLFEVHDAGELCTALHLGARLIGVNNRNLKTFETRLEHTLHLLPHMPEGVTCISESGIRGPGDAARLRGAGVHGILVGEHLLRHEDLHAAVRRLMGA
jgi:indole-3-glycerol phosphate synthase